ncbi:MAG: Uracil-regulated protein 1 [Geoglossum umbratile]|nr:MAG: Uracil-regulated protein 1 [Geoglossum umbratile]
MDTDSRTEHAVSLADVLAAVKSLHNDHQQLTSMVESINGHVDALAGVQRANEAAANKLPSDTITLNGVTSLLSEQKPDNSAASAFPVTEAAQDAKESAITLTPKRSTATSRIILTTYPGQVGIDPVVMNWGHKDPSQRGPVVVSRGHGTLRRRNAIGAHGGSYAIYNALAIAINDLKVDHKPDFTNTDPAANIGPFPQWADPKKIVSMDPLGHLAPWIFNEMITREGLDIRPTIAITKAHMKLPELEQSVKSGRLVPDGKICLNRSGELAVTKFAVEPVWYLPGVAERFGIGIFPKSGPLSTFLTFAPISTDEGTLRRALFENTGGSFPELITRGDIKLFLPPIGGLTVYCFGDPAKMSDPNVRLALRVHDECNGSDVFGSDICTCRPYLIFGVEEAVKEAQKGGSGVVIYFRKEGRALGEVTKYLVYNARKSNELSVNIAYTELEADLALGKRGTDRMVTEALQ